MTVPEWVQDSIFYQIFPDRFFNGDISNDPPNVQPWGAHPSIWGFQGGDLQGIIQRFDYLLDLGINAIYLNPIFLSASNHRYNTMDYYRIDPKLGRMDDFHKLIDIAHRNGTRVLLDGVFNHCGRGFFAFADVLENMEHSPYKDWFHIEKFPLDAFSHGDAKNYKAWWNFKSLPKFNTDNPRVRKYLLDVAGYWIEQGADGWRLDVPNEIDDDAFWEEFRHVVKSTNPDAYLVGEIWTADTRWVGDTHFDGLMNYPVRECIINILGTGNHNTADSLHRLEVLTGMYPSEIVQAMYVPLGSHDTERIRTMLNGELDLVKLAFLIQFAYPGAPAIYYGDEVGVMGGKDPDCRAAFPWDKQPRANELHQWVKMLISLRKSCPAIRRGIFKAMYADNSHKGMAFARILDGESILIVINADPEERKMRFPVHDLGWSGDRVVRDRLTQGEYSIVDGQLDIQMKPRSGVWLV